jgi:mannose-1-phosphate guanylyltransferase / mannose-6-phosphate isomerase
MLWNIGIFCAKMSVFIQEFKKLAPKTFEAVHDYFSTGNVDAYYNLESISVDYAIMEKSDALLVIPADFEWSDVGNLDTFLTLNEPTKNQEKQISIESQNNLVMAGNKLTVLIGVEDLCIVQTDDVLLIAKRGDVEKVKLAVNELRKNNLENYL